MFLPIEEKYTFVNNLLSKMEKEAITFKSMADYSQVNPMRVASVIYGISPADTTLAKNIGSQLKLTEDETAELGRSRMGGFISPSFHSDLITSELYRLLISLGEYISGGINGKFGYGSICLADLTLDISREDASVGSTATFTFESNFIEESQESYKRKNVPHLLRGLHYDAEVPSEPSVYDLYNYIITHGVAIRAIMVETFGEVGLAISSATHEVIRKDLDDTNVVIKITALAIPDTY